MEQPLLGHLYLFSPCSHEELVLSARSRDMTKDDLLPGGRLCGDSAP